MFEQPSRRLVLALGALLACAPAPIPSEDFPIEVLARPVPLSSEDGTDDTVGRLRYRAGFHLTADRDEFGGFSGLAIDADGRRLTAVSDRGWWLAAELVHDAGGTLAGFRTGRMGPLLDDDGRPVAGRDRRDAEELAELPGLGTLVTFEGDHRAALYGGSPPTGPPRAWPTPEAVAGLPANSGLEAAAVVDGGRRLLLLAEDTPGGGVLTGWLAELPASRPTSGGPGDLEWQTVHLTPTGDFQPTGAAALPSGDVVLLERSYSPLAGTKARLSLLDRAAITAGATLAPTELARIEAPLTVDNMEAVAARLGPQGEVLIYLLSDDNYSGTQRTLLMQFELLSALGTRD